MLEIVFCDSSRARTIPREVTVEEGHSGALSMALSVTEPTARPTSAAARAGKGHHRGA